LRYSFNDVDVFHLVLTSAKGLVGHDLHVDFLKLVDEVRISSSFEYVAVFTSEGHGVVHCLFHGCYLPKYWFESKWSDIHHSFKVYLAFGINPYKGSLDSFRSVWLFEDLAKYLSSQNGFIDYLVSGSWLL